MKVKSQRHWDDILLTKNAFQDELIFILQSSKCKTVKDMKTRRNHENSSVENFQ
jgi:hypothetical protein